jgi:hypothetical protein
VIIPHHAAMIADLSADLKSCVNPCFFRCFDVKSDSTSADPVFAGLTSFLTRAERYRFVTVFCLQNVDKFVNMRVDEEHQTDFMAEGSA